MCLLSNEDRADVADPTTNCAKLGNGTQEIVTRIIDEINCQAMIAVINAHIANIDTVYITDRSIFAYV